MRSFVHQRGSPVFGNFFEWLIPLEEIAFKLHVIHNSLSRLFIRVKGLLVGFLDIKTMGIFYYTTSIDDTLSVFSQTDEKG